MIDDWYSVATGALGPDPARHQPTEADLQFYRVVWGLNPSGVWQHLAEGWDPYQGMSEADAPMLYGRYNWPIYEQVWSRTTGQWSARRFGR